MPTDEDYLRQAEEALNRVNHRTDDDLTTEPHSPQDSQLGAHMSPEHPEVRRIAQGFIKVESASLRQIDEAFEAAKDGKVAGLNWGAMGRLAPKQIAEVFPAVRLVVQDPLYLPHLLLDQGRYEANPLSTTEKTQLIGNLVFAASLSLVQTREVEGRTYVVATENGRNAVSTYDREAATSRPSQGSGCAATALCMVVVILGSVGALISLLAQSGS